jgi:hypothetical protein
VLLADEIVTVRVVLDRSLRVATDEQVLGLLDREALNLLALRRRTLVTQDHAAHGILLAGEASSAGCEADYLFRNPSISSVATEHDACDLKRVGDFGHLRT